MPRRRCHHGDNAERRSTGQCLLCLKQYAKARQKRLTLSGERAAYLRTYKRRKRLETVAPCVCGKPSVRMSKRNKKELPGYCSVACREADTMDVCRRIIEARARLSRP